MVKGYSLERVSILTNACFQIIGQAQQQVIEKELLNYNLVKYDSAIVSP